MIQNDKNQIQLYKIYIGFSGGVFGIRGKGLVDD